MHRRHLQYMKATMMPTQPVLGMVLKGYPRISETFISNEILRLEELGFRVRIFSMRQPRESFCHESVKRIQAQVDYLPETLLTHLPVFLFHNILLAAKIPGRYAGALAAAARRFLRTKKSATIKHLFQAGYLVNRLLPASSVAHLHAHFAHSPTSVAMFASLLSGLPFSFTGHAKDIYTSNPEQLREKIEKASFVVTCTEYNRRYLERLSYRSRKPIHCVYHGIDINLFAGDQADGKRNRPYRILTVARLTAKKGLPVVYRALRRLKDRDIPFQHTLIGDGDDRKEVLALIRDLGLESVAEWRGTLPHGEVVDRYRNSDLFVIGCRIAANGDRDGIPNVLVESMAMGVPVVATSISAIPELIQNGRTGLLVPPNDPEKLAAAMERLLTDEKLRETVIPEARAHVRRFFNNRQLISDLAAIYRKYVFVDHG